MPQDFNKKIIYFLPVLLLALFFIVYIRRAKQDDDNNLDIQEDQKIETLESDTTPNLETELLDKKIIPGDTLCSQITKEFVMKVTGVTIVRVGTINDVSITACDYYLTNDNNSPYIAIILNKNLNVEVQKNFVLKQKLAILTDPRVITDHYIVKDLKEDRVVRINLVLDPENFITVTRNVERAIDNEGLIKLATELSKRL
jgi:hypothetical protein